MNYNIYLENAVEYVTPSVLLLAIEACYILSFSSKFNDRLCPKNKTNVAFQTI